VAGLKTRDVLHSCLSRAFGVARRRKEMGDICTQAKVAKILIHTGCLEQNSKSLACPRQGIQMERVLGGRKMVIQRD